MVENKQKCTEELKYIVDILILNGTITDCPGLVHGKTGIAIFFFHYARLTKNVLYEEYANDLVREILLQIHINSPADYKTGIAGIGVGLDYLLKNRFLNADDDVFEDFDQRMVRAVLSDPWQDFSLYDGLAGYGRYWLMRLRHQPALESARKCLLHIHACIDEQSITIPENEKNDVNSFLRDLREISGFDVGAMQALPLSEQCQDVEKKRMTDLDMEKPLDNMGLLAGYAGEGMMRLTALNHTDMTWINLL